MTQRRFDRAELDRRFAPYKCRKIIDICDDPRVELWETGWGEPFTLSSENEFYDEWQWRRVYFLILRTLPSEWPRPN